MPRRLRGAKGRSTHARDSRVAHGGPQLRLNTILTGRPSVDPYKPGSGLFMPSGTRAGLGAFAPTPLTVTPTPVVRSPLVFIGSQSLSADNSLLAYVLNEPADTLDPDMRTISVAAWLNLQKTTGAVFQATGLYPGGYGNMYVLTTLGYIYRVDSATTVTRIDNLAGAPPAITNPAFCGARSGKLYLGGSGVPTTRIWELDVTTGVWTVYDDGAGGTAVYRGLRSNQQCVSPSGTIYQAIWGRDGNNRYKLYEWTGAAWTLRGDSGIYGTTSAGAFVYAFDDDFVLMCGEGGNGALPYLDRLSLYVWDAVSFYALGFFSTLGGAFGTTTAVAAFKENGTVYLAAFRADTLAVNCLDIRDANVVNTGVKGAGTGSVNAMPWLFGGSIDALFPCTTLAGGDGGLYKLSDDGAGGWNGLAAPFNSSADTHFNNALLTGWAPENDGVATPAVASSLWTKVLQCRPENTTDLIKPVGASSWFATAIGNSITGDGYLEFTTDENNTHKMCGLSAGGVGASGIKSYEKINFAIYLRNDGTVAVYELGSLIGNYGVYVAGEIYRVQVVGADVLYKRNGVTFLTRVGVALATSYAHAAIHDVGATLRNCTLVQS